MDARDSNFLDDGTVDPFTGLAPALSPEEQQRQLDARRAQLRLAATRTGNTNLQSDRTSGTGAPLGSGGGATGAYDSASPASQMAYDRLHANANFSSRSHGPLHFSANEWNDSLAPTVKAISRDPVTAGILLAPLGVAGAGAAFGGDAAATGSGSLVGSNTPGLAFAGTDSAGAEAVMNAARVPVAAGTGAPAAGAAAPSLGGMVAHDLAAAAPTVAMAAAPYAINALTSGKTKEEKALLAKQEQLAHEAKVRQGQQQDARMNQLGQQLLAFNPSNQLMAKMYGPDAAYSPEQMANMVQGQKPPDADPSLINYQGTDPKKRAEVQEWIRRKKEFDAAEAQRRDMMLNGITQPGPGPTPIQMSAPQAARRY